MPLLAPLNDRGCLGKLHASVLQYMRTESAKRLAEPISSIPELCQFIRHLDQRDDLGDPNDGPRLSCDVTQRLRLPAYDPNCFERLALFLALALLIEPTLRLTSASMMMDNGMHSFPVELRDGRPRVIVLDPFTTPLHNAMSATAYQLRNASPMSQRHLVPWFKELAWNACTQRSAEDCYQTAMNSIRHTLLTGKPLRNAEQIDCVFDFAHEDAQLFGAHGRTAFDRVEHSLRNLSSSAQGQQLQQFIATLLDNPLASQAIKAALVAKFGPVAAIALEGLNVATAEAIPAETRTEQAPPAAAQNVNTDKNRKALTSEEKNQRMRRMTLAFRPTTTKEN